MIEGLTMKTNKNLSYIGRIFLFSGILLAASSSMLNSMDPAAGDFKTELQHRQNMLRTTAPQNFDQQLGFQATFELIEQYKKLSGDETTFQQLEEAITWGSMLLSLEQRIIDYKLTEEDLRPGQFEGDKNSILDYRRLSGNQNAFPVLESMLNQLISQRPPKPTPKPTPKVVIDPEIREVVDMHATDPRGIDGKRVNEYGRVFDLVKKEHRADNIIIRQMPSLTQARWSESLGTFDPSNYCGYYCVFTAEQLAKGQSVMNRPAFAQEFPAMLMAVKKMGFISPGGRPYENIEEEYVIRLLEDRGDSNKIVYVSSQLYTFGTSITELETWAEALKMPQGQRNLLTNFIKGTQNDLILITRKGESAHYVTMNITRDHRNKRLLRFDVYDSLGGDWYSREDINGVIKPLYQFLNQKFIR